MKTKYGIIPNSDLVIYFKRLVNQMYKLMPIKENKDITYDMYLTKLIYQLHGGSELIVSDSLFVELIFNLESLFLIKDDIKLHNSIIKENISICQKIIKKIDLEESGGDVIGF